jgi:hypothetical protein
MISNGILINDRIKKGFLPYGNKEGKSAYIKTANPIIMEERYFRLLEIKAQKTLEAKRSISDACKNAWKIARKQSRFYAGGRKDKAEQSTIGKTFNGWTKKQELELHALENTNDNGFGVGLDMQALYECFLAARAAILGGYITPRGKVLQSGYVDYVAKDGKTRKRSLAGNAASRNEVHQHSKTPLFNSDTDAQKAHQKAWKARREDLNESPQSIDVLQFGDNEKKRRDLFAKMLRRNRRIVSNHAKATGSKRWKALRNARYRALLEIVKYALDGTLFLDREKGKCNDYKRKVMNDLHQVVSSAIEAQQMQDVTRRGNFESNIPRENSTSRKVETFDLNTDKNSQGKIVKVRVLINRSYTTFAGAEVPERFENRRVILK